MIQEYKGELMFAGMAIIGYLVFAAFDASHNFVYFAAVFGLFGLVVAWKIYDSVDDLPPGNEKMEEIADAIHEGAMALLSR
ncbi:MAG: sodium-translocating pyrophosphatase, partial [Nitrospinae bacterium]|nr:sodium-translocating pyrophosphatase [Nitrospinota bacterium]